MLGARVKKIKISREDKEEVEAEAEVKEEKALNDKPLKPGDAVRMIETMAAGEVIEIKDKMVQIETGSLRFYVPVDKIERITRSELKKSLRANPAGQGK